MHVKAEEMSAALIKATEVMILQLRVRPISGVARRAASQGGLFPRS